MAMGNEIPHTEELRPLVISRTFPASRDSAAAQDTRCCRVRWTFGPAAASM